MREREIRYLLEARLRDGVNWPERCNCALLEKTPSQSP